MACRSAGLSPKGKLPADTKDTPKQKADAAPAGSKATPAENRETTPAPVKAAPTLLAQADTETPAEETGVTVPRSEWYELEELGIRIRPVEGWEKIPDLMGMSLVIQEPKSGEVVYDVPTFQRNITVVVGHAGAPIDAAEAENLKSALIERISNQGGVEEFRLDGDPKFFDYRAKNDGLIIYSSFRSGDVPMAQMHIFVSGEDKRVLLTYTDMAERFHKDEDTYARVWASMTSAEVLGQPPFRYRELIEKGVGVGLLCCLGALFLIMRRRRSHALLQETGYDATSAGRSGISSIHTGWHVTTGVKPLDQKKKNEKKAETSSHVPASSDAGESAGEDWFESSSDNKTGSGFSSF